MNAINRLLFVSSFAILSNLSAHEDDRVVYSSTIGGEIVASAPSHEFLASGKEMKEGDKFEYEPAKAVKAAKESVKKIPGFSEMNHVATLVMQADPNPFSRKWFFVVTIIDEHENIARIIVNTEGKAWPFGVMHDPFGDDSGEECSN